MDIKKSWCDGEKKKRSSLKKLKQKYEVYIGTSKNNYKILWKYEHNHKIYTSRRYNFKEISYQHSTLKREGVYNRLYRSKNGLSPTMNSWSMMKNIKNLVNNSSTLIKDMKHVKFPRSWTKFQQIANPGE